MLCGVPLEPWLSRPSDQKDSSWMPLDAAKLSNVDALPVVNTSALVSLTPIIGVLPSIAHSCAEVFVVQIWPSWVCRALAACTAAAPMSIAGP